MTEVPWVLAISSANLRARWRSARSDAWHSMIRCTASGYRTNAQPAAPESGYGSICCGRGNCSWHRYPASSRWAVEWSGCSAPEVSMRRLSLPRPVLVAACNAASDMQALAQSSSPAMCSRVRAEGARGGRTNPTCSAWTCSVRISWRAIDGYRLFAWRLVTRRVVFDAGLSFTNSIGRAPWTSSWLGRRGRACADRCRAIPAVRGRRSARVIAGPAALP